MLDVTVLTTDAEFDSLQRDWEDLLENSDQQVFFLRWHWVRSWWRFYAPANGRLLLIACRDAGGRLVGLAPLYEEQWRLLGIRLFREVRFLGTGGLRISEHVDLIARRGAEAEVGRAVAEALRRSITWERLLLWSVPATSTVFPHFRDALGSGVTVLVTDHAYVVDTSRDWQHTKRGFRHDLDRTLRGLWRAGAHDTRVQTPEELEPALDDLIQLHQARWIAKGQPGSFSYPGFEAFLRESAAESLARGRLGLWRLMIDGRCAAALIGFVDFGTVHYFQSGFDPASPYSLGRIMVGVAIRDCVAASGVRRFDLMGGEAGYKVDWTADTLDSIELECLSRGVRAQLFKILRAVRDRGARVRREIRRRLRGSRP